MSLLRKTSVVIVGCLIVMVGLGASAQAEVSPYSDGVPAMIERYVEFARAVDYVQALEIEQGAQYVQAVQAQQEADRQRELNTVHISDAISVTRSSSGGGDCYSGPVPAYIVNRESGGNPTAVNPSGAYGCFQIMPYVWSANCNDLDRGVSGQIECANRISNGGTNLSPWATG